MNKDSAEYKRVREEISGIINTSSHEYNSKCADQILSIKGIAILSDEQGLPPNKYPHEYTTLVVYGDLKEAYREGQTDMKEANFKKII